MECVTACVCVSVSVMLFAFQIKWLSCLFLKKFCCVACILFDSYFLCFISSWWLMNGNASGAYKNLRDKVLIRECSQV